MPVYATITRHFLGNFTPQTLIKSSGTVTEVVNRLWKNVTGEIWVPSHLLWFICENDSFFFCSFGEKGGIAKYRPHKNIFVLFSVWKKSSALLPIAQYAFIRDNFLLGHRKVVTATFVAD